MKKALWLALAIAGISLASCGKGEPKPDVTPEIAVSSLTINTIILSMRSGSSKTLTATVTPDNATYKTVIWSSSATDVATVDNAGNIKAVGYGMAIITAAAGGKKASCQVQVDYVQ